MLQIVLNLVGRSQVIVLFPFNLDTVVWRMTVENTSLTRWLSSLLPSFSIDFREGKWKVQSIRQTYLSELPFLHIPLCDKLTGRRNSLNHLIHWQTNEMKGKKCFISGSEKMTNRSFWRQRYFWFFRENNCNKMIIQNKISRLIGK